MQAQIRIEKCTPAGTGAWWHHQRTDTFDMEQRRNLQCCFRVTETSGYDLASAPIGPSVGRKTPRS